MKRMGAAVLLILSGFPTGPVLARPPSQGATSSCIERLGEAVDVLSTDADHILSFGRVPSQTDASNHLYLVAVFATSLVTNAVDLLLLRDLVSPGRRPLADRYINSSFKRLSVGLAGFAGIMTAESARIDNVGFALTVATTREHIGNAKATLESCGPATP